MSLFGRKKPTVVTHSGKFHSDEVFAIAALEMALGELNVTRTRDEALIAAADYVLDVGAVYDESKHRFDHHQQGGAGKRANGVPYASFGLIWKRFGPQLCGSDEVAVSVDKKLVQPIDAHDNGYQTIELKQDDLVPYTIAGVIFSYLPTWNEPDVKIDDRFLDAVTFAKELLNREIRRAKAKAEANSYVEAAYAAAEDKRLIVLENVYPWPDVLLARPEPLFVVAPDRENATWHVSAVNDIVTFKNRKDLPAAWAGKRNSELADITGVEDAVFCHNARFLAVAKTKEGALHLAKLAIDLK